MSWSLQLQNGDFTVGGAQLGTVTDTQKLVQDLRCALMEPMGNDPSHPAYGSLIDGGTTPDGATATGVIGRTDFNQAAAVLDGEIMRIARDYQSQQLSRAKNDRATYNRVSLSPAEVLLGLGGVTFTQQTDALIATVPLQTAASVSIDLALPVLGQDN